MGSFLTAFVAFMKALPQITDLMNKLVDGVSIMAENAQIKAQNEALRKAINEAKNNHNTTSLDDLFGGK